MLKDFRSKMNNFYSLQICSLVTILSFVTSMDMPMLPNVDPFDKIRFKGKPVAPCIACKKLVQSFLTAVEETSRKSFAGGDADWEKAKLGTYENSELRFIEIQEMLCHEVGLGKDQCYNLAEQHESELEDWFYEKRKKNVDLYESLCIDYLKVCCPNNTYGPNCIPCPGGIEQPCGGRGKCLKGGTREEPATCFCDAGYKGELCDECEKRYYQELDSETISCKLCDRACKDHCRGPGPQNCEVCAFGFRFVPNEGCVGHFDDYTRLVKIPDDSNDSDSEMKSSDQVSEKTGNNEEDVNSEKTGNNEEDVNSEKTVNNEDVNSEKTVNDEEDVNLEDSTVSHSEL